jgi:hypothetical protein
MRNYLPMASGHQEMTALEKLLAFRQLHHSKKRDETMLKKAALHILFHNWKQGISPSCSGMTTENILKKNHRQ